MAAEIVEEGVYGVVARLAAVGAGGGLDGFEEDGFEIAGEGGDEGCGGGAAGLGDVLQVFAIFGLAGLEGFESVGDGAGGGGAAEEEGGEDA